MRGVLAVVIVSSLALTGCKKKEEPADTAGDGDKNAAKVVDDKAGQDKADQDKAGAEEGAVDTKSPEAKLARYKECWSMWNEGKLEELAEQCYTEDAKSEQVGYQPPIASSSREERLKVMKMFKTGFSDMKAEPQLILVNGDTVTGVVLQSGTNDGELMGAPASNQEVGFLSAHVVTMNEKGQVTSEKFYDDQMSILKQLGVLPEAIAKMAADKVEQGWEEKPEVIATDGETEKKNIEVVKAHIEAAEKGDMKAILGNVADDIRFHYVPSSMPVTSNKDEYKKAQGQWLGMVKDPRFEIENIWAAGDWVVADAVNNYTMKVNLGNAKTKGKSVTQKNLHLWKVADGKIQREIIFTNELNGAVQLGMIDLTMLQPGGEGGKAQQ